jgi:crossover junction endodeoxyribonuclease RusA
MKRVSFTVPLVPPSVNHYVKHTRSGRHYVTAEAKAFKEAVAIVSRNHGAITSTCEVAIVIYLGKGMRGDLDNFFKVTLDSLVSARIIRSDSDIEALSGVRRRDWKNPRTEITVTECEAQ